MNTCVCGNLADDNGTVCFRCAALHELGLRSGATDTEVKTAYRLYVKAWHPDRFPGDEKSKSAAQEKLKTINSAYDFLTSPSSKKGQTYRPKAATPPAQPQEPTKQKQSSAKQPPPAGGRDQAAPPKGNSGGQTPPRSTSPIPPTPSVARRWGILFGMLAGRFRREPRWAIWASVAFLILTIFFVGMALSFTPATISKRANILDSAHHYNLGGIFRKLACIRGSGESCDALADMYENGKGIERDLASARKLYLRAAALYTRDCARGSADTCRALASLFKDGKGVEKDTSRAEELYAKWAELDAEACDAGNGKVCWELGTSYSVGGDIPQNHVKAAELYGKACNFGEAYYGCLELGTSYKFGWGVPKSAEKAVELYIKGCNLGEPFGCTEAGEIFDLGEYATQDYARAAALYSRACDAGDDLGCDNLGDLYRDGNGVPHDAVKAKYYYSKSCSSSTNLHFGCDELKKVQGLTPDNPSQSAFSLPNGTEMRTRRHLNGRGELTVENGSLGDAVVHLVDLNTGKTIRTFYVKTDNTFTEQQISPGLYGVYFATGIGWNVALKTFNLNASYSHFGNNLEYTERIDQDRGKVEKIIYKISLQPVQHGNAEIESSDKNSFDKMMNDGTTD
jgi:TPR repeat protein